MRKSKKALALLLALSMSVATFGCGKTNTKDTNADTSEAPAATVEASAEAPEASAVTENTGKFYIYSWNTELEERLKFFKEKYPEDGERIQYVNVGDDKVYQEKIDGLLASPESEDYPDLFAAEAGYIKKYTNSDYTLPITELGITDADYAQEYPYTLEIPVDQRSGEIKGLSWQACPGSMMYRRDLAQKYLGTEDPEQVQEFFKDWPTFLETARKINADSNGKTKILSGNDDVQRVYLGSMDNPWVDESGKFTVDQKILDYMDTYKALEEENLTNKTSQWTEQWYSNCANDSTFAYFGCTWFLHWTIKAHCDGEKVGEGTYGKWAMCQGPSTYYWGGTWLCATQNCADKELAGKIMKTLCCETDVMEKMAEETLDYVNNKEAVNNLSAAGKGAYDFLGGQDFLAVFSPLAENVDVSWMSAYDQKINDQLDVQVKEYAKGKKSKDEAIEAFKAGVLNDYPTLTVE